ncbi:ATPase domain-containing protein [Singulisphaera sp. PoT]|uniref:ATPase domain-containing protein n=1 Tax=Singulisphaera sp. PoT TaxID=3411797 RepID=UPI003BF50BF0
MTSENSDKDDPFESISTGVPGLDHILGGGLLAHQLYIVEGDSGAGKTTLALQFLLEGMRRGEKTIWCTLSETESQLLTTARSHGWDLTGIEICNLAMTEASLKADSQYSFFSPGDIELDDVTKAVTSLVERINPSRVVFDPFSDVRLLAQDPLRYRRQVLSLREFFAGRRCTVLLVQELPRGALTSDDNSAEGVVQGVISLHQSVPDYGRKRRRLNVHKLRGVRFRDGFHDFSIETGGLRVYPRLVASEHFDSFTNETISSGVPELDALLGGGLNRGTSLLAMGPAGVGKSTLAGQFAAAALRRGERAAFFLFDETSRAFVARSEGLGMGLYQYIKAGQATLRQVDPAEFTPGEFAHLVRRVVEQDDTKLVVIDSLSGYLNGMPDERFLSMHLHELLTYLSYRNTLTILTANEHGIVGEGLHGAVDVSYLADAALMLRYFEAFGGVRRAISAVKRRMGPHETLIRELTIAPPGIKIGGPLKDFHGVLTGQPAFIGSSQHLGANEAGVGEVGRG